MRRRRWVRTIHCVASANYETPPRTKGEMKGGAAAAGIAGPPYVPERRRDENSVVAVLELNVREKLSEACTLLAKSASLRCNISAKKLNKLERLICSGAQEKKLLGLKCWIART